MANALNTINGKAFEYACLKALFNHVNDNDKTASIITSKAYETAERAFEAVDSTEQNNLVLAADTAVKLLSPLEPMLLGGNEALLLSIASDSVAKGTNGDVRDVLISRNTGSVPWNIGISCKHNHEALRHPRITEGKDFGYDWIGIHCSDEFMETITPITDSLISCGKNGILWRNINDKQDNYYVPILNAYQKEIVRMCNAHSDAPEKLLSYFFGANDFYKVIMRSNSRTTTIEGFNMHGTLNMPSEGTKAMTKVSVNKMPSRLIEAAFKKDSKTTIILTFDGGWSVSMRLHNKDDIAKPTSLAWDINLVGLPPSTYVNLRSWDEK